MGCVVFFSEGAHPPLPAAAPVPLMAVLPRHPRLFMETRRAGGIAVAMATACPQTSWVDADSGALLTFCTR